MNKRLLQHIIFWLAYLLFEAYLEFAWISSSFAKLTWQGRFMIALSTESMILLIKIPLTYLVIYIIDLFYKKRKPVFLMCVALLPAFIAAILIYRPLVVYFFFPYIYHETSPESLFDLSRSISSFLDLVFIVGVAFAVKQYRHRLKWREIEKNLTNEKLAAELNFLKAQTNPHFLFNTLNNIYGLARKNSDKTADVVMKLSNMLRYMLYETSTGKIAIENEIKVITDYLELEKLRYDNRLKVVFSKTVDNDKEMIAPLLLLPFVENAFKHGAGESRFESYISIDLKLVKGQLDFEVRNSKEEAGAETITESIGLRNTRRQLELIYPAHKLIIENTGQEFIIKLNLNLDLNDGKV